MEHIPNSHADPLRGKACAFACLATIIPDGYSQVNPAWFSTVGVLVLINLARGRSKDSNLRSCPTVARLTADPRDLMHYLQVGGHIAGITRVGSAEHTNPKSPRYRGRPWTAVSGQSRATYKLVPDRVSRG
jgi:hypothetical protein